MKRTRYALMVGLLSATLAVGATPAMADSYPKGGAGDDSRHAAVQRVGAASNEAKVNAWACSEGRLCLYDNRNGGGLRLAALTPPNDWELTSASVNRANSVWNRTPYLAVLRDHDCNIAYAVDPWSRVSDLGAVDRIGCSGTWNNKIDSGWFAIP